MKQDVGRPGAGVPSGERAGVVVGRLIVVAVAVAALGGCAALAVHAMRPGPAQQQVAAPRAVAPATAVADVPVTQPSAPAQAAPQRGPRRAGAVLGEARDSLSAQLSTFATLAQLEATGMEPPSAFVSAARASFNDSSPVIADVASCPMAGNDAMARIALVAGLREMRLLWGQVASGGSYNPTDYSLAQAAVVVAARYVPAS